MLDFGFMTWMRKFVRGFGSVARFLTADSTPKDGREWFVAQYDSSPAMKLVEMIGVLHILVSTARVNPRDDGWDCGHNSTFSGACIEHRLAHVHPPCLGSRRAAL